MNLADVIKISTKRESIYHLVHRAHKIKALQLLGRDSGNAGSENRAVSPTEPQKEQRSDVPNKTLNVTE